MPDQPRPLLPGEIGELLRATGATVRAEVSALTDGAASWHPGPGEWCAKEVVGHLIEAERRGFAGRVRAILEADEPRLETWDQEAVQRERNDCARSVPELVNEFWQLRWESVGMVGRLRGPDLARAGLHPQVGPLTIGDLLHEWVHHDREHVKQLFGVVQGYVWPSMGAAQKFTTG